MMSQLQKVKLAVSLTAFALLTTACGGQAYTQVPTGSSSNNLGSTSSTTKTSSTNTTPASDDTSTTPTYGTSPAIKKSFTSAGIQGVRGYTSYPSGSAYYYKVTGISTDNRLTVDLSVNSLGKGLIVQNNTPTTNFSGVTFYSTCVQFDIAIYESGTTRQIGDTLQISANTYGSGGSGNCGRSGSANPTVDLGSYLSSGHGKVDIMINNVYSDTTYGNSSCYYGYCDLNQLYFAGVVYGSLTIHTNTTL
jgi:hypothetical protein